MYDFASLKKTTKATGNRRRLRMVSEIKRQPGITVDGLNKKLSTNYKTISMHLLRLYRANLIRKTYHGTHVQHHLTENGKNFMKFIDNIK